MSSFVVPTRRSFLVGLATTIVALTKASAEPFVGTFSQALRGFGFESFVPVPPGLSYQWVTVFVKGDPQLGNVTEMLEAGWQPVPAQAWQDKFAIKGPLIEHGGQLLVQRPAVLTESAMEAQHKLVQAQISGVLGSFSEEVSKVGGRSTGLQISRRGEPRGRVGDEPGMRRLNNEDELQAWLKEGNDDGGTG